MPIIHAIILGMAQGLTEFMPVSSSAHLQLIPWLFEWNDFTDETLEKAFDVALHVGTLVGVVAYFWRDILGLITNGVAAVFGKRSEQGRLAWLLILSAIPAAITGVTLKAILEDLDDVIWLTAVLLIVFGLILGWSDTLVGKKKVDSYHTKQSVSIGVAQALALQPGVSRSGVSMSAGRAMGFDAITATRIAFLMSIPVIAGAALYLLIDIGGLGGVPNDMRAPFLWGMVTSAVTGYIAVWATLRLVRSVGFRPFVVYRVALGVFVLFLLATGIR
jgi:undecaprenyl-diphosphatase